MGRSGFDNALLWGDGEQDAVYVKGRVSSRRRQRAKARAAARQQQQQESSRSPVSGEGKGALSNSSPPRTLHLACRTPD
jgi:hypothetical protein